MRPYEDTVYYKYSLQYNELVLQYSENMYESVFNKSDFVSALKDSQEFYYQNFLKYPFTLGGFKSACPVPNNSCSKKSGFQGYSDFTTPTYTSGSCCAEE